MTSDGLTDQIGGEKRRGFGKRRFRDLIAEISPLPLNEQRERIWQALVDHQGSEHRRDDVSVIGFRL
jgi:serine phosphatase RsbU (regulator of sigma subunit)